MTKCIRCARTSADSLISTCLDSINIVPMYSLDLDEINCEHSYDGEEDGLAEPPRFSPAAIQLRLINMLRQCVVLTG